MPLDVLAGIGDYRWGSKTKELASLTSQQEAERTLGGRLDES